MKTGHGNHEIIGQYASDNFIHAGHPGLGVDQHGVATRGDGNIAMHHSATLFDANEGEVDVATGRRHVIGRDDHLTEVEGMAIVPDRIVLARDRAQRARATREKNRASSSEHMADEWMRQNNLQW
jgi:hypothetical protein